MNPTKSQKKEISKLIKGLPVCYFKDRKVQTAVYGDVLIRNGVTELKNGTKVDSNKRYLSEMPEQVNHYCEALVEFKENGMLSVAEYIQKVIGIQEEESKPKPETIPAKKAKTKKTEVKNEA